MSHAHAQSTLSDSNALGQCLRTLDLEQVAVWYAFESATSVAVPVSTGTNLSEQLFDELLSTGALRKPQAHDKAVRRALYDPFSWCYSIEVPDQPALLIQLQAHLRSGRGTSAARARVASLWGRLADAEVHTYLAHLMRKNALDPVGAEIVMHALADDWATHPLGRKRYLAWRAVRGGAAALLQSGMDQSVALRALIDELRRRCRWLLLQEETRPLGPTEHCFLPELGWRTPMLVRVLQEYILANPHDYWTQRPTGG